MNLKLTLAGTADRWPVLFLAFSLLLQYSYGQGIGAKIGKQSVVDGGDFAAPLTLQWDASPSAGVAGYILHYGLASHSYTFTNLASGNVTTTTVSNLLSGGVYYFAVTAFDAAGTESDPSNEISYTNQVSSASQTNAPPVTIPPVIPPVTPPPIIPPITPPPITPPVTNAPPPLPPTPDPSTPPSAPPVTNSPPTTQISSNLQSSVLGLPPRMGMVLTNGLLHATIWGTMGATVTLETSTNPMNPASWRRFTDIAIAVPAPSAAQPATVTPSPSALDQAFVPGTVEGDLTPEDGVRSCFYRVVMPYSYPILADSVLTQKGYQTHLIVVRLPGITGHDTCHVAGESGYIDFNEKTYVVRIAGVTPAIRAVAEDLATYLGMNWTSASVFTYANGARTIVNTVVKTDAPELDPPLSAGAVSTQKIKIDF